MILMEKYKDLLLSRKTLAIVDPPYGIGDFNIKTRLENGKRIITKALPVVWNNDTPPKEYFDGLERVSTDRIIWGANYYNCFTKGGALIWHKGSIQDLFSQCEIASLSFQQKVDYVFIQWQSGFVRNSYEKEYKPIHPCQKPIALYKWLLEKYGKGHDLILDTHVGSASSLIACEEMGFDYIGFELDKDYYEAATKRIENYRKQEKLFKPERKEIIQETLL